MAKAARRTRRQPRQPGRRHARRHSNPLILLLCEGSSTEPNYLNALKVDLRLQSTRVQYQKGGPQGLVDWVEKEIRENASWDEIWCILDHDERVDDIEAFRIWLRGRSGEVIRIEQVLSVPCFEYWLLLHFEFTTQRFRGSRGGRSACEHVIRRLRKHLPSYSKSSRRVYEQCESLLATAIERAKRTRESESASSTGVWKLIGRLKELSSSTQG